MTDAAVAPDGAAHKGASARLARRVASLVSEPVSAELAVAVQSRLLHALGVSVLGSRLPQSRIALQAVAGRAGDCTIFGSASGFQAADAALVNGVMGHASLFEDTGPGGPIEGSHPSTYVVPAAISVAEERGASGLDLIRALAAGYEVASRVGAALPAAAPRRGFRPVPMLAPFGAAASAAILRGLSEERLAAALDIAANMGGGLNQGFLHGTMEPYIHAGLGARSGIAAVELADAGYLTAPDNLEGRHGFFATYAGEPGRLEALDAERPELSVSRVKTKMFPSCLQNQETMALIVLDGNRIEEGNVARIVLRRPRYGTSGLEAPAVAAEPPFPTMLQRQMSARFTAAAALLGRNVRSVGYFDAATDDYEVHRLAGLIELEPGEGRDIEIDITLRDGTRRTLAGRPAEALHPSADEIRRRFVEVMQPWLGDRAAPIAATIDRLHEVADVRPLLREFRTLADGGVS